MKMMRSKTKTIALDSAKVPHMLLMVLLAIATYLLLIAPALASEIITPMGTVVCEIAALVYAGNLGAGLATLAIITVGVGAALGRVHWGTAITVAVGIAVVFGAPTIALEFTNYSC